jgi:hypothetical protein
VPQITARGSATLPRSSRLVVHGNAFGAARARGDVHVAGRGVAHHVRRSRARSLPVVRSGSMSSDDEELPLAEAITHLLEECRMVLPGVQALFGFQLIAVFSQGFADQLSQTEQRLHLLALALVAMAGALILTPAAYHRQTSPQRVSERFLRLGGRLLLGSMLPLIAGIGIDFYLIAHIILGSSGAAAIAASGLVAFFVACWFVLPRIAPRGQRRGA